MLLRCPSPANSPHPPKLPNQTDCCCYRAEIPGQAKKQTLNTHSPGQPSSPQTKVLAFPGCHLTLETKDENNSNTQQLSACYHISPPRHLNPSEQLSLPSDKMFPVLTTPCLCLHQHLPHQACHAGIFPRVA